MSGPTSEPSSNQPRSCIVTIQKDGVPDMHESLRRGLGLQALAVSKKIPIEFDCRQADCGICIVRVVSGQAHLSAPTEREADFLKAMRADSEERLSCQCRVNGDITVRVEY